jgi:hypothetical protein
MSWMADEQKFREMVMYVAERGRTDPGFSMTKLNKVLYYADFMAYRELGRPISGVEYVHLSQGPVADPLSGTTERLEETGEITTRHVRVGPYIQEQIEPNRRADREAFTEDELAIINKVIGMLWGRNAREVSELSRQELGWRLTRPGEVIPYRTAWLSARPLTDEEIAAGRDIAEQHGLLESAPL